MPAACRKYAAAALRAAVAQDWEIAAASVRKVNGEFPHQAPNVLLSWIDTLIRHIDPDAVRNPRPIRLMFSAGGTGPATGADQVRPAVAWSGRLIAARAAMDEEQFRALLNAAPRDTRGAARWMGELLGVVAMCLRADPARLTGGAS